MSKNLELNEEIGERIRKIRNELDLTKEALGKKLGVTGQFLGVVERGKSTMSYDKLRKLCDISGYSADYILFGKKTIINDDTKKLLAEFSEEQIRDICELITKMSKLLGSNNKPKK
jgi:transcriptional regulator with XRE-family HTH domain